MHFVDFPEINLENRCLCSYVCSVIKTKFYKILKAEDTVMKNEGFSVEYRGAVSNTALVMPDSQMVRRYNLTELLKQYAGDLRTTGQNSRRN